jgi:hypothetical protein
MLSDQKKWADIEQQTVKVEVGEVHLMFKLMRILLYE